MNEIDSSRLERNLYQEIKDAPSPREAFRTWDRWLKAHGIEPAMVVHYSDHGLGWIKRDVERRRVYYRSAVIDESGCWCPGSEIRYVQLESPPLPFPTLPFPEQVDS